MLIDTNHSQAFLFHLEESVEQFSDPRVIVTDPISPRFAPSVCLRGDLLDAEEISLYISQMLEGKYEYISIIFEEYENYKKNQGYLYSPLNLIFLWNYSHNNEIKMDLHYLYNPDRDIQKITKAISKTKIEQLTICAGSDAIVDDPTLSWRDVISVTNALKDSSINKLKILTPVSMYPPNWDGLIEFADSLCQSSIVEFRWNKMFGHGFDRKTATELFKEHLSDEQWRAFGNQFQF